MAIYIEVVKEKNETPVKGAKVVLQYQDGYMIEGITEDTGVATFSQGGMLAITVNGHRYQSQIEIEDEEMVTIAVEGTGIPKIKRSKKIRLHTVNANPILPANQPSQRQVLLQVKAPENKLSSQRPPFNICIVVDCSSSMVGDKIDYVVAAAIHTLNLVKKDDRVSVVTFNKSAHVILPNRKLNDKAREQLIEQINQVGLDGQTNLSDGWLTGCRQLLDHKSKDSLNWVLLFTDGLVDAGITDPEALTAQARQFQQQGINTHTFGVGRSLNQQLLQDIANAGGGKFDFIDQQEKFPNYLSNRLRKFESTILAGHNVAIELTLPTNISVNPLQTIRHTHHGNSFRMVLGEVYARQDQMHPVMFQMPPYPVGQQICIPAKLSYQDAQLMPVTVNALPICFTIVAEKQEESSKPPPTVLSVPTIPSQQPHPSPQPLPVIATQTGASAVSPMMALLSGGMLFFIGAAVIVGMFLFVPTETEPETVAVVDDTAEPVVVAENVDTPVAVVEPLEPTVTRPVDTPTKVATVVDKLILPTNTPSPIPTATDTPVIIPTETNTPVQVAPTSVPEPVQPVEPTKPQAVEGLAIGNLAPDFTLGSTLDTRVSLSDLRGKGVILYFWTTWCPYCVHEIPDLEAIHNEYGPQGIVVLAVNQGESLKTVEKFAWDTNVHFAIWLDEDQWAGRVYAVRSYPTTYFIDPDGIIRDAKIGAMPRDEAIRRMQPLLKK